MSTHYKISKYAFAMALALQLLLLTTVGGSPLPGAQSSNVYTYVWDTTTSCCEVSLGTLLVTACEPDTTEAECKA